MVKKSRDKNSLSIIIVGCGKVGSTLVEQLSQEGNNDITVVDKDRNVVHTLCNTYDVMGVVGNGGSYNILMDAGIEKADLMVAVTDSDELNLLCCVIAKQVGNCATIARVRTPDYSTEVGYIRQKLGLTMIINPEEEAAKEAARILYLPSALEINPFAHGQAEMIKFRVPQNNILDGMTIAYLGSPFTSKVLICAVERSGQIFIPSGAFRLAHGDIISFVSSREDAKAFLKDIGFNIKQVASTMIIGGGKSSYYLAKQLLHSGIRVKIIEKDPERCEELSDLLPNAVIINEDGSNEDVLKEEGIAYTDSFVPLTGIDEENILLTLYARQVSDAKVITKINRISFNNVINSLDLGSVIYPRYITSEAIIAYVRAKQDSMGSNIETLYHLFDHRVEAIEFRVDRDSEVTDTPLMNLNLKRDLLIAFINRKGQILIPSGRDCIMNGDTVMIVTTHPGFNDISDILRED